MRHSQLFTLLTLLTTGIVSIQSAAADAKPVLRQTASEIRNSEETFTRASTAYKSIVKENKIPGSVRKKATCVAVFPRVVTAALAVGGTHGNGVAFCRTSSGWGSPVFLNLNRGSLGIQAGVKSTDIVLFIAAKSARDAIEKGQFSLSGELSAVAGTLDGSFEAPSTGVVSYTSMDGVFAGASVGASDIRRNDSEQRGFYGKESSTPIFERVVPRKNEKAVQDFKSMLPS